MAKETDSAVTRLSTGFCLNVANGALMARAEKMSCKFNRCAPLRSASKAGRSGWITNMASTPKAKASISAAGQP